MHGCTKGCKAVWLQVYKFVKFKDIELLTLLKMHKSRYMKGISRSLCTQQITIFPLEHDTLREKCLILYPKCWFNWNFPSALIFCYQDVLIVGAGRLYGNLHTQYKLRVKLRKFPKKAWTKVFRRKEEELRTDSSNAKNIFTLI